MDTPVTDERVAELKAQCYRNVSSDAPPPLCLDVSEMILLIQELEEHRLLMNPINQLICEADASVTLVGVTRRRNARVKDPNAAVGKVSVVVSNDRTNWKPIAFVGETYADALARAADKYRMVS